MAQYKIESCKAIEKGGRRCGTNDVAGYRFHLLINSHERWITVVSPEAFLSSTGITNVHQYRKFCEKVLRQTMDDTVYDKIKDPWKENNKECFALVHSGRIAYKRSWEAPEWYHSPCNTQKETKSKMWRCSFQLV